MKPSGPTDPNVMELIEKLYKSKSKAFTDIARALSKSKRKKKGVSLLKISKLKDSSIAVPDRVIGSVPVKMTIYALGFSKSAQEAIAKAGGSCKSLEDMLNENAKVRIII